MNYETKINEYLDKIKNDKLIIETQFANIESLIKENETIAKNELFQILYDFNILQIKYEQLCENLIYFISVFKLEDEYEVRLYKVDELVELLEQKTAEITN